MVKFLYISFYFPPLGGAESRYNLSLIRRFLKRNFLPTIITVTKDVNYLKDNSLEKLIPKDIKIIRCKWSYSFEKYIFKIREILRIPANPLKVKGWKNFYKIAKRELKSDEYKFIYAVYGIGASLFAGVKLKKYKKIPLIIEFRDPLVHNIINWKYMKTHSWRFWYLIQFKKAKKQLKFFLKYADLIVVESPIHKSMLINEYKIDKNKIVDYGMGYEEDYFKELKKNIISFLKKPVIGFVGHLYFGYEYVAKNFIFALKKLEEKGYSFTFISIGDTSNIFSKYALEYNLEQFIPINWISLKSALSLMQEMDFGLVVIEKEYKSNINSKIWEYLKLKLSILGIVPEDGAMGRIIKEGRCGYILSYEKERMITQLQNILENYKRNKILKPSDNFINKFSREKLIDKLIENIVNIL